MPLLWGKTRCPVVAGWQDRIATKVVIAGSVGAAVGSVLGVLQQQSLVRMTAISTASYVLLAACFATLQETARLVRCKDSPVNSAMAGAGTGALLYKAHGHPAAKGAAIVAAVGAAAHWAFQSVDSAGGLRSYLVSVDLLDPHPSDVAAAQAALAASRAAAEREAQQPVPARPWWHAYLPVQKMNEAEWREYKAAQGEMEQAKIEAALAGGLPAVIKRRQQEAAAEAAEQPEQGNKPA